jgi:hypothetical protein
MEETMELRGRTNDERQSCGGQTDPSGGGGGGGHLEALRQQATAFLAAGNAIINATLSGNSEAFLAANRQQGGQ